MIQEDLFFPLRPMDPNAWHAKDDAREIIEQWACKIAGSWGFTVLIMPAVDDHSRVSYTARVRFKGERARKHAMMFKLFHSGMEPFA